MDFYQKIKSLRLKEKQSQKELAELLDAELHKQYLNGITTKVFLIF